MIFLFKLGYGKEWKKYAKKLDKPTKERIWKSIQKLKYLEKTRHLKHGVQRFALNTGQYRICFSEIGNKRIILFVGNHKQYEKWLGEQ